MRYKIFTISLLLLLLISCGKNYEQLSTAVSFAQQGMQNIQSASDIALQIKENIINGSKEIPAEEKEKLLNNYQNSLKLAHKNFQEALSIYKEINKEKPNDAFVLNNLGHAYMWLNQKERAQDYFNQALKYCKSRGLKESIKLNMSYFPEIEKHYALFREIDKHFQEI
jgi:tetratricopeptide (TPR) repeat protein